MLLLRPPPRALRVRLPCLPAPRPAPAPPRYTSTMPPPPCASAAGLGPEAVAPLLAPAGGRWTLSSDGRALERSFRFKTFAKAWDFMTAVSLQCKVKNHHPEWSNVYNTTFVRWTTHSSQSLSDKDVAMAAVCDAIAKDFGELEPEPPGSTIRELADKATSLTADCCGPKK